MPYAVEIPALREGVVATIHALEGDRVEAGALLITLESRAQEIARDKSAAEFRAARAELEAREIAATAAALTLTLAIDAERALKTTEAVLAETRGMLRKVGAEIDEADAMAREARDECTRKQSLVSSGGASEGDVRRLGFRASALEAKTASMRLERIVREAKVAAAQADVDAATIVRRELIVLTRLTRPGSRVGGDAGALLTLYDSTSLQVRCDVPLKDAGKLLIGLTAEIRVDALPDRVFIGKVLRIVPQGDLQKNTVQCKVSIDSPDPALRPDMLARVRIAESLSEEGIVHGETLAIPALALRDASVDGTTATVIVAIPDKNAARTEMRQIVLGATRASGWIEVIDGLHAGDRVVLDASIMADSRILPTETLKGETP